MTKWNLRILSIRDEELKETPVRQQTYELVGENCKIFRNLRRQPRKLLGALDVRDNQVANAVENFAQILF